MDKVNELQNVEASKATSSEISSVSHSSKKTKLFYSHFIYILDFTSMDSGA